MPIIYDEPFTAVATFTGFTPYNNGTNGVDSNYPAVNRTNGALTVAGGKVTATDYGVAGIRMRSVPAPGGYAEFTPFHAVSTTYNRIIARYNVTSGSLADIAGGYAPIISVYERSLINGNAYGPSGSGTGSPIMVAYDPVTGNIEIELAGWDANISQTYAWTPTAGEWEFKIEFRHGTVVGAWTDVLPDGFVRIYRNGTLIHNQTSFDLWIDDNENELIDFVDLGYDGLIGEVMHFTLEIVEEEPPPDPPTSMPEPISSTPAVPGDCCEPGDQTTQPIGATGEQPIGEGWVPVCTPGTGAVGSYAAVTPPSMAGIRDPQLSMSIAFKGVLADQSGTETDETEYFSADVAHPDTPALNGYKRPLMAKVGEIIRTMSDDDGNYAGTRINLEMNDKDRSVLRTRMGTFETQFVWEREVIVQLGHETLRRAGSAKREMFRGVSTDVETLAGFNAGFSCQDRITAANGRFAESETYSRRRFPKGMLPGLPSELSFKPGQWVFGEVSDNGATVPATGALAEKGRVPLWLMGARGPGFPLELPSPSTTLVNYDEYHLSLHACKSFTLYGSDGNVERPKRVKLDLAALGAAGDVLAPGYPNWPFADPYLDVLNPVAAEGDGRIHRVTHIFIKQGHYITEAHKRGSVSITANVCGVEDVGDGSGNLITDLFSIYQFIFEHLLLPDEEYHTGLYPGAPLWADGRSMVHSISFAACQARSVVRVGGRGYQGGAVVGGPGEGGVSARELLRRMSISGNCWFAWTGGGQVKCIDINDYADMTTKPLLTHPRIRSWPTIKWLDEIENPVFFNLDYDDDLRRFAGSAQTHRAEDPAAWARMGRSRPSKTPVAMRFLRREVDARDVAQRRLTKKLYPTAYYAIDDAIDGVDLDPGDEFRLTSPEGVGANGSVQTGLMVQSTSFDWTTKRTRIIARALDNGVPLVGVGGGPGGTIPPVYGDLAAAGLAAVAFTGSSVVVPNTAVLAVAGLGSAAFVGGSVGLATGALASVGIGAGSFVSSVTAAAVLSSSGIATVDMVGEGEEMSLIPGGFQFPPSLIYDEGSNAFSSLTINAADEEAWGIVQVPKTGIISKVAWSLRTVTTGGTVDVRLETVDLTTGNPSTTLFGTTTNGAHVVNAADDNTVALTTLTAGATVTQGDLIAVVIKNPNTSFGNMGVAAMNSGMRRNQWPYSGTRSSAGSYVKSVTIGQMVVGFEYDDTSYAPVPETHPPASVQTTSTVSTSTTPDAVGLRFKFASAVRVRGAYVFVDVDGDCALRLVTEAYHQVNQTGVLASITIDKDVRKVNGPGVYRVDFAAAVDLTANTWYRLIPEPTTTTSISIYDYQTLSLAMMEAGPGSANFHLTTAKDPTADGSWTNYNSGTFRVPYIGLILEGVGS